MKKIKVSFVIFADNKFLKEQMESYRFARSSSLRSGSIAQKLEKKAR